MQIDILGYGSALESEDIGTSLLINKKILIEAPPAISNKINKNNYNINDIEIIFVSHLHGDHYFGLPFLLLERSLSKNNKKLKIIGCKQLKKNIIKLLELSFPNKDYSFFFSDNGIEFCDIENCKVLSDSILEFYPIQVKHTIETYGLFLNINNKKIFYSSDTRYFFELQEIIKKSDINFIEATTLNKELKGHMTLKQLCDIAMQNPEKLIYAMHRSKYVFEDIDIPKNLVIPNEEESKTIKM